MIATIAGHICVDLIPELTAGIPHPGALVESGPLTMRLGGCVANTGLALACLGADVQLVASVGDDLLGDAAATMLGAGTARIQLTRLAGQTTSYSVVIQAPGEDRRFLHHVGANESFGGSGLALGGSDLLHVGYPQLLPRLLTSSGAGLADVLAKARAGGVTTSVDFANVDDNGQSRPWPEILRRWAPLIDILTPSVSDLAPMLTAQTDQHTPGHAAELADALVRAGVGIALVTAGSAGMALRTASTARLDGGGARLGSLSGHWSDRQLWAPSLVVEQAQTTGAGDTATAAFLFGVLAGFDPDHALRVASAAAALHVSGVDRLPAWSSDSYYENPQTVDRSLDALLYADGWNCAPSGLLHGPADKKGKP